MNTLGTRSIIYPKNIASGMNPFVLQEILDSQLGAKLEVLFASCSSGTNFSNVPSRFGPSLVRFYGPTTSNTAWLQVSLSLSLLPAILSPVTKLMRCWFIIFGIRATPVPSNHLPATTVHLWSEELNKLQFVLKSKRRYVSEEIEMKTSEVMLVQLIQF